MSLMILNEIHLKIGLLLLLAGAFWLLRFVPHLRSRVADFPLWGAPARMTAREYRAQILETGFPILTLPWTAIPSGELPLLAARAKLELLARPLRGNGRHVWRREIPGLGLVPIGWGRLIVTTRRLFFVGHDDTLSLPLQSVTWSPFARGLLVRTAAGAESAYFFRCPYAMLFGEALSLLRSLRWERVSPTTVACVGGAREPTSRTCQRQRDLSEARAHPREFRVIFERGVFLGGGRRSS